MLLFAVLCFLYSLLCMGIARYYNRLKEAGFWWTLFFCFTLTPVIGIAIVRFRRYMHIPGAASEFRNIVVLIISFFLVMGGVLLLIAAFTLTCTHCYLFMWPCAGVTGAGIYGIYSLPAGNYEEEEE